ncbi:MAG: hypothetical protein Dasosvirus3_8 [Dasosvirus sp.]|uniref:Uncharacterized protein n=1 Tax=Dasosvirus sp. TaxID=2487764 RepID=A0A3G4ZVI9_9VIRU|nr:MAG: hypothetical protein Dasosvirus3_8 [Dasosvirus sp.]
MEHHQQYYYEQAVYQPVPVTQSVPVARQVPVTRSVPVTQPTPENDLKKEEKALKKREQLLQQKAEQERQALEQQRQALERKKLLQRKEQKKKDRENAVPLYYQIITTLIPHCTGCGSKIPNKFFEPHRRTNTLCNSDECVKYGNRYRYCAVCAEYGDKHSDPRTDEDMLCCTKPECHKLWRFIRYTEKLARKSHENQIHDFVKQIPDLSFLND